MLLLAKIKDVRPLLISKFTTLMTIRTQ